MGWLRRLGIVMMCCASALCVHAATDKILVIPTQTFQTMTGWEATGQAGAVSENDFTAPTPTPNYNLNPAFANYKNPLFDLAINELGLNRIRLEINSGAENSTDYFAQYLNGQINFRAYLDNLYNVVPNTATVNGIYFSGLDFSIDNYVLPMKQRIEANGESLFVNLNFVDFNRGNRNADLSNNSTEYARFMLVTFQHIQGKYGWVPDAIEIILEPENGSWTASDIASAMGATQSLLSANGFNPKFIIPSVSFMENAVPFLTAIKTSMGSAWISQYVLEASYHLYGQSSTVNRNAIRAFASSHTINTSQLEYAGFGGAGGATEDDLRADLKEANVSAWQQYTIAFPTTLDDRSQYFMIDQSNVNSPTISLGAQTKYFYQYFKFIRRGAVRIGATTNNSGVFDPTAFINANGSYVVVVKNWNSNAAFDIQNLPAGTYGITYTTNSQYKATQPDVTITAGQELPVSGVTGASVITIYSKSLSGSDTTPPTAPTTVTLGSVSSTTLTAQWSGATDNVAVTGYRLDVSTASNFVPMVSGYNNLNVLNVSSRVISGLSANTTYYARVRAYDAAGNMSVNSSSASAVTLPPPDTTAPVISAVSTQTITSSGATIIWTTNEASDSQVEYGLTTSYGQTSALDTSMVTSHSANLSGLSASTLYHYRVKSRDTAGNLATSGDFTFTTSAPTSTSLIDPELPRTYVDTTLQTLTGNTITVNAGGNLQTAINNAQYGDTIVLQAGATFTGNFQIPAKTGSGWIYIQSSAINQLPTTGNRVSLSNAAQMPKILTANASPAIQFGAGSHHIRLIGIEVAQTSSTISTGNLIQMGYDFSGAPATSIGQLPSNIIIDRCYLHGRPDSTLRRAVLMDAIASAVIDSYIADCHEVGADSQAIYSGNGAGPFKIINNYLEGAGENVMFGGNDPTIPGLIPSDIEVRLNYARKQLSWQPGHPTYAGVHWVSKNLFELKNAQRVLLEGNIFENNWAGDQSGYAIVFTPRNQNGTAPQTQVADVTFRKNKVINSASGINLLDSDDINISSNTQRVAIRDNLFYLISSNTSGAAGTAGTLFRIVSGGPTAATDINVDHNTLLFSLETNPANGGRAFYFGDTGIVGNRVNLRNNILSHAAYGVFGNGVGSGTSAMSTYLQNYQYTKNVIIVDTATVFFNPNAYPANNFQTKDFSTVGFIDPANNDFRLQLSSLYKNAGTDGNDIGADINSINTLTANVLTGTSGSLPDTSAPTAPTSVSLGSASSTTLTAQWSGATDNVAVTGYRLDVSTVSNFGTMMSGYNNLDVLNVSSRVISGLSANTTYYARVRAYDAAGNMSVNSSTVSAVTLPPPDTTAPILSAITASGITISSATISWTTNEASDTQVFYGTTTATTQSTTLNSSMLTSHTQALTGLLASTTYYFKVLSRDAAGNLATSTNSSFVTLTPPDTTAPILSSIVASGITTSSATISWSTDEASDTQVFYGTTTATTQSTTLNSSMVTSHSQALTGLLASTTYYFKVLSRDAAGNLATSTNSSFVTLTPPDTTAPILSAITASGITISSATISWTTNEASDTQVFYGTTTATTQSTTLNSSMLTSHTQALTGLLASTTYYFKVLSRDAAGNLATSTNSSFVTLTPPDTTAPILSSIVASGITTSSATISWTTNEASDTQVEYGLNTSYGQSTTLNSSLNINHSVIIPNLNSGSIYHFRVKSRDAAGNLAISGDFTLTTLTSSTPPMVPTLSLPSVLTVMDTIHVDYPGSMTGISFIWTFQRTSASSSGSGAISLTPSAVSFAPTIINATSSSNLVNLSSLNLPPGNYTITVQAQNSSGTSASATAFVSLTAANLSQARVFPNPWRSDQHTGQDITFDRLTMDGTVKLFDLSGRFIQTLTAPTGSVTWDRRNDSGETVASGIYFYVIEDTSGNKKRGKLVIIR